MYSLQEIDLHTSRIPKGFTLIEILVALAVFAVMSLIAYRGVSETLLVKQRLDVENRKWRDLTLILGRFDEDVSQIVNRNWRDRGGVGQPSVRGGPELVQEFDANLEMIRFDPSAGLVHVGYRVKSGKLEMLLWDVIDQAPRTEPAVHTLLDQVKALQVRFLDPSGQWHPRWPQAAFANNLPRGVELKLTLASGETITRLLALP